MSLENFQASLPSKRELVFCPNLQCPSIFKQRASSLLDVMNAVVNKFLLTAADSGLGKPAKAVTAPDTQPRRFYLTRFRPAAITSFAFKLTEHVVLCRLSFSFIIL